MSNVEKKLPKVKEQIMRLVQRYMETDRIDTEGSVEAIVVEAVSRVKEELAKNPGVVFSVNGKGGKVKLCPKELNAEIAFDKKSAFNKDFGTDAGTIAAGDDIRLSDKRIPLDHNHSFNQVKDIPSLNTDGFNPHRHSNKNAIDKMVRNRSSVFDLIETESAMSALKKTINDAKMADPLYQNKADDLLVAGKAQEDIITSETKKINDETVIAQNKIKGLKDDTEITKTKEAYIKTATDLSISNQDEIDMVLKNARKQTFTINIDLIGKNIEQRFYIKPAAGSGKYICFETKYEFSIDHLNEIKDHTIQFCYKDENGVENICENAVNSRHGMVLTYEIKENLLTIRIVQMLKVNKNYTNWTPDLIDKKVYALSPDSGSWESVYANNNTDYGSALAVIPSERVNSMLSSINDAWISGRKMDNEWYWYYDQITHEDMTYASWGPSDNGEFLIYNNTGWSSGSSTEERKGIIEWKFDDIDFLHDSKIIIKGRRL